MSKIRWSDLKIGDVVRLPQVSRDVLHLVENRFYVEEGQLSSHFSKMKVEFRDDIVDWIFVILNDEPWWRRKAFVNGKVISIMAARCRDNLDWEFIS